MIPRFSYMEDKDLSAYGLDSDVRLARALGKRLNDYIVDLENTEMAYDNAQAHIRIYVNQIVPELRAEIARLTAALEEKDLNQ